MSRCVAGSSPFDYEMSELTWENGQLAMHGLGPPRAPCSKFPGWEKPRATTGTLESIVDQATTAFPSSSKPPQLHHPHPAAAEPVPRSSERHRQGVTATSAPPLPNIIPAGAMVDALVPSTSETHHAPLAAGPSTEDDYTKAACGSQLSGGMESVTLGGSSSRHVTIDTCGTDFAAGFTSASRGSPGNTDSGKRSRKTPSGAGNNDGDSVCHQRAQREEAISRNEGGKKAKGKSYGSSGSRTAFVHNQSERKRRDRINQRLRALQRLVPNSSKTNTASVLDEAIEYLKQLQAQVYMMSTMGMSPLIFPQLALQQQQQLQLSMMAPTVMGMGMEMGMGLGMRMVDLNRLGCPNIPIRVAPMPHPTAFMPEPSPSSSTFFTCPSQPVNMDAYNRMAAWYERPQQPPPTSKDRPS